MNAAFIGVESHFVYTKSSAFFIELLRDKLGNIKVFPSDWRWIHLPLKKRWDLLVFWQHFPEPWELDSLDAGSVVLVPMLDNCPKDEEFWRSYKSCKILCFSSALGDLLRGFGQNVLVVQYFPPVPTTGVEWNGTRLKAFFWPRKDEVNWSHLKPLLASASWSSIHLHITNNLSEVHLGLSEEEAKTFPIATSAWFDSVEDYWKVLREHQVFFAPRRYEGIGASFLEALSLGMAVISPDNPTMNEYIRSGVNGYLYDPERPEPPSWRDAQKWGFEARRRCIVGREEWLRSVPAMMDFLMKQMPSRSQRSLDPKVARTIMKAWPGYIRYSVWKGLLAVKRILFPRWKRAVSKQNG